MCLECLILMKFSSWYLSVGRYFGPNSDKSVSLWRIPPKSQHVTQALVTFVDFEIHQQVGPWQKIQQTFWNRPQVPQNTSICSKISFLHRWLRVFIDRGIRCSFCPEFIHEEIKQNTLGQMEFLYKLFFQRMVNWWFGILGVPLSNNLFFNKGIQESKTTNPLAEFFNVLPGVSVRWICLQARPRLLVWWVRIFIWGFAKMLPASKLPPRGKDRFQVLLLMVQKSCTTGDR